MSRKTDLCNTHWRKRREAAGDSYVYKWHNPEGRFLNSVDKSGPVAPFDKRLGRCWLWTGLVNEGGYGKFRADGKNIRVHRWSYERYVGPIPNGMEIDHLCEVTNCVNPAHLEAVPRHENMRRRFERYASGRPKMVYRKATAEELKQRRDNRPSRFLEPEYREKALARAAAAKAARQSTS